MMMAGVLCIQSMAALWRWVTKYTVRYGFLLGRFLMTNVECTRAGIVVRVYAVYTLCTSSNVLDHQRQVRDSLEFFQM